MSNTVDGAGYATLEELRTYWRMPSLRATRELAKALGVIKLDNRYPWLSIWAAEGLAPPPARHWQDLKQPHLTSALLAQVLCESPRSARRRDRAKPDSSFPDPIAIRLKPKLWRSISVHLWAVGLPVPNFKLRTNNLRQFAPSKAERRPILVSEAVFDPWKNE